MEIISRAEARQRGLKFFFTGCPCKHGHICERYASTGICKTCSAEHGRGDKKYLSRLSWRLRNKSTILAQDRERYQLDPEKMVQAKKDWRAKNRDKHNEIAARSRRRTQLDKHLDHTLNEFQKEKPWA